MSEIVFSQSIQIQGTEPHITFYLADPIRLSHNNIYTVSFYSGSMIPYSVPSVSVSYGNNTYRYAAPDGTWFPHTILESNCDITELCYQIHRDMKSDNNYIPGAKPDGSDDSFYINISFSSANGRTIIEIEGGYKLDLTNNGTSTLYDLMGFTATSGVIETNGVHLSDKISDVTHGNLNYHVLCDLAQPFNRIGNRQMPIIHSFCFTVPPMNYYSYDCIGMPRRVPMREMEEIQKVDIQLINQDGKEISSLMEQPAIYNLLIEGRKK